MSEAAATPAPAAQAAPKKPKKASGPKKPKAKPNHPPTGKMVNSAISGLKERNGSSLQAIKKYIAATYKVDVEKQSSFIKKYLKSAVAKGILIQTKGTGASGSFKIKTSADAAKPTSAVKKVVKKTTTARKPKTAVKKPTAAAKKTGKKPAAKKTTKPKVGKPAKAKKSPSKVKKVKKAVKPKVPKPKKVVTAKK